MTESLSSLFYIELEKCIHDNLKPEDRRQVLSKKNPADEGTRIDFWNKQKTDVIIVELIQET